jgi:hypothetical protein
MPVLLIISGDWPSWETFTATLARVCLAICSVSLFVVTYPGVPLSG